MLSRADQHGSAKKKKYTHTLIRLSHFCTSNSKPIESIHIWGQLINSNHPLWAPPPMQISCLEATFTPQHIVTNEEHVVMGRRAAPVPSPSTPQGPKLTPSHTQLQLRRMRERWRNKVTSASRSNLTAEVPEQSEETVRGLWHLTVVCLLTFLLTAACT